MTPITPDDLVRQFGWRYATKKFDPARKIPEAQWHALEQVLLLAPSSFGLQPWRAIVVADPALRERLVPVSWNQRQVADASHLVVFAIKKGMSAADADRYIARIAEVRGTPAPALQGFRKMMVDFLQRPKAAFDVDAWAAHQAYIALGNLLAAAAIMGIDACPMEGLDPARYDEVLGLSPLGLHTVFACPLGYRAADDKYARDPKVRLPAEELLLRR
jgi:nitroreductase